MKQVYITQITQIIILEVEVVNSTSGPPYTYQWFDENMNQIVGETNPIIENLCQAWYFVTTTDANNCESLDSVYGILFTIRGNC